MSITIKDIFPVIEMHSLRRKILNKFYWIQMAFRGEVQLFKNNINTKKASLMNTLESPLF